jgi:phosphate transport system substrate-binding protein
MKRIILSTIMALALWQCTKPEKPDLPNEGEITIAADESLQPIVDAQLMAYNIHYPKAKLHIVYVPEQKAMAMMMNDSANIAIVTREANANEMDFYTSNKIPYLPAKMALDGVALIVNKESKFVHITLKELKAMFDGKSEPDIKLVFDNSSSSNLNYMIQKLDIKDVKQANIFAANGNKDVIDYIKKNTNAIGIIGGNWLSDTDDRTSQEFSKSVRVLGVAGIDNPTEKDYYHPTTASLKARKYPLERKVILHTKKGYGLAKAFIRFCCSQIGQLVVEKSGLLPYYMLERSFVIDKKTPAELQTEKK